MIVDASEGDVNLSKLRERWQSDLDAPTQALLAEDARYFLHQSLSTPCLNVLERAEGAFLIDHQGRAILDFHGNSVHQVGYGHPKVLAAIRAEMARLPFCPRRYTHKAAIDLAKALSQAAHENLSEKLSRVLLAPSGSAAVSMALKLARHATGRFKTISFWDSFHGANLDTAAIGGEALFRRSFEPLAPGANHLPPLHLVPKFFGTDRPFDRFADYIDYILGIEGDIAAFIAEPVRWTSLEMPPEGFWKRVRQSCDRHGTLLIFDEIPSCLARCGHMFVCQMIAVCPDILVIGKGLGGGLMPMAAILTRESLNCAGDIAIGHYTHEKSPLGCAAALATLEIIAEEKLLDRARFLGARGAAHLEVFQHYAFVRQCRNIGCYFAIELLPYQERTAQNLAETILYQSLRLGLSFKIGAGNVLTLCPPLTIALEDFDRAFAILAEVFAKLPM